MSPSRRVILLGASNLVRSLPTVVETTRLVWQQPLEIMAAIGHGRSYGENSSVCGRKISGIFPCKLWKELQIRRPLPTAALITDIGNDLVYGVPVGRLLEWVEACLDRLVDSGVSVIMTQLPLGSIEALGERRYRFFRAIMFPQCSIPLPQLKTLVVELNRQLLEIGARRKIPVIPVSDAWYGIDPIHLKRGAHRHAWPTILSAWRGVEPSSVNPRASFWQSAYLRCLAPSERSIFGWRRCCEQPSGLLDDGTTISLY